MSWTSAVVESLAESKRTGMPFDGAWQLAIHRHPPRLHELGISRGATDTLFDQTGVQALAWWRGVCEAAYHDWPAQDGGPSRMRGLRAALEGGFVHQEVPRVRVRGHGAVAA